MKELYKKYLDNNVKFDKETWIGIFCLIIVISGFFGFLYEFIFYYFNGGMIKFYWRGGNFLPWINIYAIGAVMVYFLTICISLFTIILIDEIYNLLISRLLHLPRAYNVYKKLGFNYVKFK